MIDPRTADFFSQFAGLVATFLTFEAVRDFTHAVMPTQGTAAAFKLLIPAFVFIFLFELFARIRDNAEGEKKERGVTKSSGLSWAHGPRSRLSNSFASFGSLGDLAGSGA